MPGTQIRNHLIANYGSNSEELVAEFNAASQRLTAYLEILPFECVLTSQEVESQFSLLTPIEQSIAENGTRALEHVIDELSVFVDNWGNYDTGCSRKNYIAERMAV